MLRLVGEWRSLVAHLHGVQGAAGSNPVSPTIDDHQPEYEAIEATRLGGLFFFGAAEILYPPPCIERITRALRQR